MRKLNLLKCAMLGMCLSMLYTGSAMAAETSTAAAPDTAVSSEATTDTPAVSSAVKEMMQKQLEIDKILFEDKTKELEEKGITITYTSPLDTAVEVAILPFTSENESFVYDLLGKDKVSVVEGVEPELMATSGLANDGKMYKGAESGAGTEVAEDDGVMTIQGEAAGNPEDAAVTEDTAGNASVEDPSIPVDDSKAAESGVVVVSAPTGTDTNTATTPSPTIIASVIAVILVLSGVVYVVQRKKETK